MNLAEEEAAPVEEEAAPVEEEAAPAEEEAAPAEEEVAEGSDPTGCSDLLVACAQDIANDGLDELSWDDYFDCCDDAIDSDECTPTIDEDEDDDEDEE